ncbi:hypothetical protein MPTK1_6g03510 [Marchantia polymorpha subsp. ruderalis]|uniref:Uncharacterized protein n=1 Tax=Marchantia polymorpha subsp. ruderalis TaxID=1480154 RepID=A0AAF6BN58_MARPO|nr:hypothetical protein Mp_6g03510 [Marchantia polymorpha subsp. ruderalis]
MEGAGASNVSHAAETQGMDSADEEPDLPSAVQDLIRSLIRSLEANESGVVWREIASLSSTWRLRVLEAIGSCNTIPILDVNRICDGNISRFTESEWEVLFRGFKSSTVLRVIFLNKLEWSSDAEVESLCSQIGSILNTSSILYLRIGHIKLSARCWLSLASGLRGNSDSKLNYLDLEDAWEETSAVKHVADMVNSGLNVLRIGEIDDMEEEAVGILSQALIQSSSLKGLILEKGSGDRGAALLLRGLAGDDGNRSIEGLWLWDMDGLGGCLRELLTSNTSLKEVTLRNLRMSPEDWRQLGVVILDNAIATHTKVHFSDDVVRGGYNISDNWESIEALACAASSENKDPTLEFLLHSSTEDGFMLSLNLLGRVLRGEIKSLKSFEIHYVNNKFPKILRCTNLDRTESILSMNGQTGETSVLKRLELRVESNDIWKVVWKALLLFLRGNTSLTHLVLRQNELEEEAFKDMMEVLQVNLTLQEINVSGTSWARDGKEGIIQEALRQNQKRPPTCPCS